MKRITGKSTALCALLLVLLLAGCGTLGGPKRTAKGQASWYGNEYQGRPTASGEPFDQNALTAAHRKYPFGTIVKVTNRRNGQSVTVRINDRGPTKKKRIIDVSRAAARELGMIEAGVVPVKLHVVRWGPR